MDLSRTLEELTAGRIRERLPHQHQRHRLPGAGQLLQPPGRSLRIAQALHAVVSGITPDELTLDIPEGVPAFVDDEEDWKRHRVSSTVASQLAEFLT
ncbi:MAG TPA: hypothetical protein VH231_14135 [Solirubrobacteraceae bacterium]|nr:hypothetical protein [Solirubrobacteraceae bacterium]